MTATESALIEAYKLRGMTTEAAVLATLGRSTTLPPSSDDVTSELAAMYESHGMSPTAALLAARGRDGEFTQAADFTEAAKNKRTGKDSELREVVGRNPIGGRWA